MERRKLALAALGFSTAVFAANYIFSREKLIYPAVVAAIIAVILAMTRRRWLKAALIFSMAFSLGTLYYQFHYDMTVGRTQALEGKTFPIYAQLTDYPEEYDV